MHEFLRQNANLVLFALVLGENVGLPVPSYAAVVLAAALAADLKLNLGGIVLVGASGALLGDYLWYALGRWRGRSFLRTVCAVSLNPDSCVSRTENLFARHGLKSLLVAKFVPGLNTVAPPLAGLLRLSFARFTLYDLGGITIWAGSAVGLGRLFRSQIEWLLAWLAAFGRAALVVLGLGLVGWALLKYVERRRFYRLLERSRISAPELKDMLDRGEQPVIVDLRTDLSYQFGGQKIPGAIHIPPREFERRYAEIPEGRPVVMYCT